MRIQTNAIWIPVATAVLLTSCATRPPATADDSRESASSQNRPPRDPDLPPPEWFESKRLRGRQELVINPQVTVHADQIEQQPDGITHLAGRIYLDGSRQPEAVQDWPRHAYAGRAEWDHMNATLILMDEPVIERSRFQVLATSPETRIVLKQDSIHIAGRSSTFAFSPDR